MGFWEGLGDVGEFVGHVGTLGIFKVIDNHDRSDNAAEDRTNLDNKGKEAWEGDRRIIGDEWSRLAAGAEVTMEGAKVTPEAFSTWSHEQIWNALNGNGTEPAVDAGQINATADGWRRLTTGTETAVTNYRTNFERVLSEKWSGSSGSAAIEAVKSYTTEAAKLPATLQMVANGIDYMEGLLGQAKIAIPKPENVSTFDEFIGHIPGNGVVKAAKHRADEAEEDARLFMIGTYQPGSVTVDSQTPVLPLPKDTVNNPGDAGPGGGNPGGGGNGGNGGSPGTGPAATPSTPDTTAPQATDQDDDETDDLNEDNDTGDDTTPSTDDPTDTTPAATTPAGTGTPTTPGGGSPGTGSPGSGSPGGGSPGSGVPAGAPGAAVPGTPGGAAAAGSGARAGTSVGAGGRGMSGMPGMMGGGRGGGKGEDDAEHAIPDYLIQDREDELIGLLPPTLPPGGVIGA
ncbi:PPE domain-containing protein [Nocardia lasii]|uniref:PPE domain-containing protein n=1 Tax=Nocardia lasii TaxID=1616107 RepID=A0ABW1JSA2_9NOCA